jgi:hypothetical protein
MTTLEMFFGELITKIPDSRLGKMFGSLSVVMENGKSAAMLWRDNIVVKLDGDNLREALSLSGAGFFEPMEGKPMKEWVCIPCGHKAQWLKFATLSAQKVAAIEKKPKKSRK